MTRLISNYLTISHKLPEYTQNITPPMTVAQQMDFLSLSIKKFTANIPWLQFRNKFKIKVNLSMISRLGKNQGILIKSIYWFIYNYYKTILPLSIFDYNISYEILFAILSLSEISYYLVFGNNNAFGLNVRGFWFLIRTLPVKIALTLEVFPGRPSNYSLSYDERVKCI